jgi:hypothetical protein
MGALDGAIAGLFAEAFGSIFLDARLFRKQRTETGGGSVVVTFAPGEPVKVQQDDRSRAFSVPEGGAPLQSGFIMLAVANGVELLGPVPGDHLDLNGARYTIGPPISLDPAGSHYRFPATIVPEGSAVSG